MKISLHIVDFLMIALALQGLILSVLLLFSSKKIPSNRWLAAFIFVVSESLVMMEMDYSDIWVSRPLLLVIMVQLKMALGPLIYLYVRSLIFGDKKSKWKSYLHFAPLLIDMKHQIIFLLYITGALSVPFVQKLYFLPLTQSFLFRPSILAVLPAFISLIIYSGVTYKLISNYLNTVKISASKLADMKSIKNVLHLVFALIGIWLISIIINTNPSKGNAPWLHCIVYFPAIVFVYWLGMSAYFKQSKMSESEVLEYTGKPVKVHFSQEEADQYQQQLIRLMIADRIYLNPLLKVDSLAVKLCIPEKSVSNLLNQHIGKNFNDFVNEYRVEEAKKKLSDHACHQFTIAAIAFDCGFNSLATFQRVFKQLTGITPSQYQNNSKTPDFSINSPQIRI